MDVMGFLMVIVGGVCIFVAGFLFGTIYTCDNGCFLCKKDGE